MNLRPEATPKALVIHVEEDRIDAMVSIQFKEDIHTLTENASERVILDMAQVTFLDSSGLGAIVAVMRRLAPERRLELAGLTLAVAKVFRLTRMDTMVRLHDTVETAIALPSVA